VTGKDVIIALAGLFNKDEVLNAAIEFTGEAIEHIPIDERLTIANMTTEWGAVAGVFPVDDKLKQWYQGLLRKAELRHLIGSSASTTAAHPRLNIERLSEAMLSPIRADPGAHYAARLSINLATLVPHVSGPNSVKIATPLPRLLDPPIPINKAYLVSCTNSRASDIAAAADVLRGKHVAPGVEFYIAAASSRVQEDAEVAGDWQALIEAGARTLPAGCGPCIGLGVGLLEKGQVGISATNRNYKGRMGHPEAMAYLASPAVVAASAQHGFICGPEEYSDNTLPSFGIQSTPPPPPSAAEPTELLLENFPEVFQGPMVFAPQDNLTTDGMYPGKYTYQDDITPERQAEIVMGEPLLRFC
jgi:homoaconitate hydratase